MSKLICAVAVRAATYAIDKLYDYLIPKSMQESAEIGCRVLVPFGRGNQKTEGLLVLFRSSDYPAERLKSIIQILDEKPVILQNQIQLAAWMREHLYCTFFDCLRFMLPTGLWFRRNDVYELVCLPAEKLSDPSMEEVMKLFSETNPTRTLEELKIYTHGRCTGTLLTELERLGYLRYRSNAQQRTQHKTQKMLSLAIPYAEAVRKVTRSQAQSNVLSLLADGEQISQKELIEMAGVSANVIRNMIHKGLLEVHDVPEFRIPKYNDVDTISIPNLNEEQTRAYLGLCEQLDMDAPSTALLFGVTGSGKTQVYLKLIARVLEQNRAAILLVPEIALTSQLLKLFVGCFGDLVVVLHSALSAGERLDCWEKIRSGEIRVVIGTRSAIFAPVQNLGLIILDEEQDSAYKSEQSPRYHTRDIAKQRIKQENALLVLGSATPSIETYYDAMCKKIQIYHLYTRYHGNLLPQVMITDLRADARDGWSNLIGRKLYTALQEILDKKEQAILLLNRRGNSRVIGCTMCGWIPQCPSCSNTLTYHSVNQRAMCHFCGASIQIDGLCPECYSPHLFTEQPGTQKLEEELHVLFPKAHILRMDADTTSTKNAHRILFEQFSKHEADILIGTQMIAKGLDFENVTLVGVLDADQSLFAQDYRARERTFSLITQVIGRAGRHMKQGQAIIQTYHPKHPVLLCAARQDYFKFYESEIEQRRTLNVPPIQQMLILTASGEQENQVLAALLRLKTRLHSLMEGQFSDFRYPILGPSPASIVRLMRRYRYHLMIRCPDTKRRRQLISGIIKEFSKDKQNKGVTLFADLNPDTL